MPPVYSVLPTPMIDSYYTKPTQDPEVNIRTAIFNPRVSEETCMFDPDKELGEHEYQKCLEALAKYSKKHISPFYSDEYSFLNYCEMATFMKIIFPERINAMGFDSQLLKDLKNELACRMTSKEDGFNLKAYYKRKILSIMGIARPLDMLKGRSCGVHVNELPPWNDNLPASLTFSVAIKALFPQEKTVISPKILEEMCEGIRQIDTISKANQKFYFQLATYIYIINPTLGPRMGLDLNRLQQGLELLDELSKCSKIGMRWYDFIELASYLRILFPHAKLPLLADREIWSHLKTYFREASKKDPFTHFNYSNRRKFSFLCITAARLKILSAEKVIVTDQGLTLVMPQRTRTTGLSEEPLPLMSKLKYNT